MSYHAHSRPTVAKSVLDLLAKGTDVALITDAGTPAISDPGAELAAAARALGFRVTPIPGPSAVAAVLSAAGLPADRYVFLGFLPRSGRGRTDLLEHAARSPWTVVMFEAAPRLARLLKDLARTAEPDRRVVVAREVTKVHEEFRDGTAAELAGYYGEASVRGEVTLLMSGRGPAALRDRPDPAGDPTARARELLGRGLSRRDVARTLAEEFAWTRNAAYRFVAEL
jgi:16S rRNA (cytidine1402-2'-O)-methyltransferase